MVNGLSVEQVAAEHGLHDKDVFEHRQPAQEMIKRSMGLVGCRAINL
jgi:hypothetical protein